MRYILVCLSFLAGFLPRRCVLWMGHGLGLLWFHVFKFRLDEISANLRLAFGSEKSEADLRALTRANCIHYGITVLDFFLSIAWGPKKYRQIPLEGEAHLQQALAGGRGAYLLCMHLGCWEYSIPAIAARGYPFDVVVKRARSEWIEKFIVWYRLKTGARTFPETGITAEIFKSLSQNHAVGFVLDQFMGPPIGLPVKFFGQTAGTAAGLALFTEKRDAPVLLLYNYRDSSGQPKSVVSPPIQWHDLPREKNDRLYYKTQVFNDMLEATIRKHPDQWLWIHRRWKAFRGEPRWLPQTFALPSFILAMVLAAGCVSNPGAPGALLSPADKAVPAEPVVEMPKEAPMQEAAVVENVGPRFEPAAKPKTGKKSEKAAVAAPIAKPKKLVRRKFEASDLPFEIGERQVVELNWTMIPAGRIALEVRQNADEKFQGRPTFHFHGAIRSSKVVDTIYRVDNTIQSYVDKEWFLPYKFLLTMDEKMQFKQTRVVFDHPKGKAHYWSDRKSERWGNEVQNRTDDIEPNALDMFSAIYYARVLEYRLNEKQEFRVYENNKRMSVTLVPVGNELVQTPVGTFQCWKLKVSVQLDNVLKPAGDMYAWLSDDFKKYLVKFDAQLKIGSLRGTLVELRDRSLASK
jgi:Kdo2-lipid IVA lauroyltransferase/acyltransferase